MSAPKKNTRRTFIKSSLGTGASLIAAPSIFAGGSILPSERFRVGHIGIGGRGGSLLRQSVGTKDVDVIALCEVDQNHLARAKGIAKKKTDTYGDHRKVLDRKDIDAVVIATPDHWHGVITIDACNAGKDVYVEKPVSTYLSEGRAMVEAARKNKRMVQVGIHHRSAPYVREIVEIIRSGRIGKVHTIKNWMWDNKFTKKTPPQAPPTHLDYDRWLGPAKKVPYHPLRTHFNFRWCRDYAGGYMTDWGVHMLNIITYAMDIDHMGPVSVEATADYRSDNLYDFPAKMHATWEFKDPDFKMEWIQPSKDGDLIPGQKYAMNFHGEKGELRTLFSHQKQFLVNGKIEKLPEPEREVDIFKSPGHFRNFLNSIKSRKLPHADVEVGHRTNSICLLGNIAMWAGDGKLEWDWKKEKFTNHKKANELLSPNYREKYKPA